MAERAGLLPQQADADPMMPLVALESASHLFLSATSGEYLILGLRH